MKYQAIIFDLFGTLVDNISFQQSECVLSEMADILHTPCQRFISTWIVDTWHMRASGAFLTLEACIEHICSLLGTHVERDSLQKACCIWSDFTIKALHPRPDAINVLTNLKSAGYKIGLISDCAVEVQIHWPDTPLAHLIDVSILSCSVQLKKPDPRIYQLACEQLQILPWHCLYIGDGSSHELSGAANIGIHPVLLSGTEKDKDAIRPDAEMWSGQSISLLTDISVLI